MANDANKVSAGKPKISGAIYRAPKGTALPTDAVSDLPLAFVNCGYVSDAGVTNTKSRTVDKKKAWGGDNVLTTQTEKEDDFKFMLIEALNEEVLRAVQGNDNVTGTVATGMTIKENAKELEAAVWVIDMLLKGSVCKRIVIPDASVTEVGDVTYSDADLIGYDVTISCLPDANGNTHYEHIQSSAGNRVELSKSTETVAAGSTKTLTATTTPAGGTVKWNSSDTDVATVTGGVITGVAAGSALITAHVVETGAEATCALTVTET